MSSHASACRLRRLRNAETKRRLYKQASNAQHASGTLNPGTCIDFLLSRLAIVEGMVRDLHWSCFGNATSHFVACEEPLCAGATAVVQSTAGNGNNNPEYPFKCATAAVQSAAGNESLGAECSQGDATAAVDSAAGSVLEDDVGEFCSRFQGYWERAPFLLESAIPALQAASKHHLRLGDHLSDEADSDPIQRAITIDTADEDVSLDLNFKRCPVEFWDALYEKFEGGGVSEGESDADADAVPLRVVWMTLNDFRSKFLPSMDVRSVLENYSQTGIKDFDEGVWYRFQAQPESGGIGGAGARHASS